MEGDAVEVGDGGGGTEVGFGGVGEEDRRVFLKGEESDREFAGLEQVGVTAEADFESVAVVVVVGDERVADHHARDVGGVVNPEDRVGGEVEIAWQLDAPNGGVGEVGRGGSGGDRLRGVAGLDSTQRTGGAKRSKAKR